MVIAAGCGSSSKDSNSDSASTSTKVLIGVKGKQVKDAQKSFDKSPKNIDACRSLAQSWIAYASPDAPKKAGQAVKIPKDRNKSLKQASQILEKCRELAPKDEFVTQMLASTYMAQGKFDKAAPILKNIATTQKNNANAWYAYGLAESSAGNTAATIAAWKKFLDYAEKNDPRIKQTQQSIEALTAEAKKPAATTATTSTKKG